jgi:hypothetical protein
MAVLPIYNISQEWGIGKGKIKIILTTDYFFNAKDAIGTRGAKDCRLKRKLDFRLPPSPFGRDKSPRLLPSLKLWQDRMTDR